MSLISNLTVYLLSNYNLSGIYVVNVVQIWNGFSNIFSIIGAFISDTYLGRFRTLFFGSISSLLVRKITCMFLISFPYTNLFSFLSHVLILNFYIPAKFTLAMPDVPSNKY